MRDAHQFLGGLARIHRHSEVSEARSLWRQGLATLATLAESRVPAPLEGLDPEELAESTQAARDRGFLDSLDFLSPEGEAVAIFELASALPPSGIKRELGRRTLGTLHNGSAETFVSLATSLALASPRGLFGARVRAKVALALQVPFAMGRRADALALALISRPELVRSWLSEPATGSLPQRRLAARLIERAAREAASRAARGDDSGLRVFRTETVGRTWTLLAADRESLVWRHVARARGILAIYDTAWAEEIDRELSPQVTITEWRRAGASLTASIATDCDSALLRCRALLRGELFERDPGLAGAMLYGLPAAAEVELDAAEELLAELVEAGGLGAAEALLDLRTERHDRASFAPAAEVAIRGIRAAQPTADDGLRALRAAVRRDLEADELAGIHGKVLRGLEVFASGESDLGRAIDDALSAVESGLTKLESFRDTSDFERREAFSVLRDIDAALLETSAIRDLLTATAREDGLRRLDDAMERLSKWLLTRERDHLATEAVAHPTLRLRRLKVLLHLVDSDAAAGDDDSEARLRQRRLAAARLLLARVRDDVPSRLSRTIAAALARALDSLRRDEVCGVSDVVLAVSGHVVDPEPVAVIAEATMVPELRTIYQSYGALLGEDAEPTGLRRLADVLPAASSPRVEALRTALLDVAGALDAMAAAGSLEELTTGDPSALERMEYGARRLAQLSVGARRRLGLPWIPPSVGAALRVVSQVIGRLVAGVEGELDEANTAAVGSIQQELPAVVARQAGAVFGALDDLPVTGEGGSTREELSGPAPLPSWLPAGRIVGGFYVVRAIGSGAGGSVFVACRAEQRHLRDAETFALKVPEYSGSSASTLSEAEFLRLFRDEAGALLSLPEHPNLARFVTFDAGAQPKPILVMEMVPGPNLDEIVDRSQLTVSDALAVLAGVAKGIGAMHEVGIAHLDVKPGNIILRYAGDERDIDLSGPSACDPVLVDFGLAGRHLRPGCASVYYGAPEVWVAEPIEPDAGPEPADVYAFACLAFELLTGEVLFAGDSPVDIVTAHLQHDGAPDALKRLAHGRTESLAEVLFGGLRKRPSDRTSISEIAAGLAGLNAAFRSLPWPLSP